MIQVGVSETRPYDRDSLSRLGEGKGIEWHFHEFALSADTVATAAAQQSVCVFLTQEALADIGSVTIGNICRLDRGEPFLEGTQL